MKTLKSNFAFYYYYQIEKKNNLPLGTKIFTLDKKAYQKDNQIYYRSCN